MVDGYQNMGGNVSSYRTSGSIGPEDDGRKRRRIVTVVLVIIILLLLGLLAWWFGIVRQSTEDNGTLSNGDTIEIPLGALKDGDISLLGTGNLTMQGELKLEDGFVISPSSQPSNPAPGQIYFDGTEIRYFNGSKFVSLTTGDELEEMKTTIDEVKASVEAVQGQANTGSTQIIHTGGGDGGGVDFTPGNGLALSGGVLSNTGVTSLQGMTGAINLTAGSGIALDGTTIRNTGIKSVSAGANITVVNDGNGNITISAAGGGGGTVTSPGGTAGRIAKFTGVQEVADSIMLESGGAITIEGDLAVANDLDVAGELNLANALSVGNGGTGTTSLANNGVVIGQGTNALTAVTAAGPGLCFMSTAAAPEFAACPAGGVTSLNGATGDLTIANSSTAGSTITLDDASTSQKGIAQFNSTNFTAAGGVVNTIQDIHTGATPTFNGVNTNTITPSSALTVGATGQSFTLQGNAASSITATDGSNTTTLNFAVPTGNNTITLPDESGTVCLQDSADCGFAAADDVFLQSGNTFGDTAVLGTQDANDLEIITGNTPRITIEAAGTVRFDSVIQAQTLGAADTNTQLCRNSANQIATCSGGGPSAFTQGGNDFGATAVLGTTEADDLQIVTNSETHATIAVDGATTFQNSADSTGAFRVLNATDVPLFQVDTTNNRVHIGSLTADGTGALLVLDTKNTSGDPDGVNGGMYYSSTRDTSRCFEEGLWTDCLGMAKPNTRRTSYFVANGDDAIMDGYGDKLTSVGPTGGTLGWDFTPVAYYYTAATTGSYAGIAGQAIYYSGHPTRFQSNIDSTSAGARRIWVGLTAATQANMAASATPSTDYASFRFDTSAGDSTWKCATDAATGTPQLTDTGLPDNETYQFEILNLVDRYIFKVDGEKVCEHTTNIPEGGPFRTINTMTTLTNTARYMYIGWIYTEILALEEE